MTGSSSHERPHRSRFRWLAAWLGVAIAVLLVGEAAATAIEPRLPAKGKWYHPSADERYDVLTSSPNAASMTADDYVVIGSSMVARGVHQDRVSELLDAHVLNMGLAGATPSVVEPWSVDHVLPATGASHVVWGVSTVEFSASFHVGVTDSYARQLADRTDWLGGPTRFVFDRSALFRHRNDLRAPVSLLNEIRDGPNRKMLTVPMYLQSTEHNPDLINEREPYVTGFELSQQELDRFERLSRDIIASGRSLTIVYMPVTPGFVAAHPGSAFNDFSERLERKVSDLSDAGDIRFLDLHDAMSEQNFADGNHLSSDGAIAFATVLSAEL